MPRLLPLALALLALAACDSQPAEFDPLSPDPISLDALSQDPGALVGTWDLVASLNAETGVLTRATEGFEQSVTFRADGTATFAYGRSTREATYSVVRRANGTRDARPILEFDGGDSSEYFGTAGDLLVLDSTIVDGPQSRYVRR